MEEFTTYFLKLLEIIEKELNLLKIMASRTVLALCAFGAGVLLIGATILILAWVCFTALSILLGPVLAGLSAAGVSLLGGGILLWTGSRLIK